VTQRRAAAPYAKALVALAKDRNQTELVGRELGDVAATFESDRDLRDFFRPAVDPSKGEAQGTGRGTNGGGEQWNEMRRRQV